MEFAYFRATVGKLFMKLTCWPLSRVVICIIATRQRRSVAIFPLCAPKKLERSTYRFKMALIDIVIGGIFNLFEVIQLIWLPAVSLGNLKRRQSFKFPAVSDGALCCCTPMLGLLERNVSLFGLCFYKSPRWDLNLIKFFFFSKNWRNFSIKSSGNQGRY